MCDVAEKLFTILDLRIAKKPCYINRKSKINLSPLAAWQTSIIIFFVHPFQIEW